MIEAELVAKLKNGDEVAVLELIELYGSRLLRSAFALTADLQVAEEVVQDTLLKVCWKIDGYKGEATFQAWVFRIMINTAKNRLRGGWIQRVTTWDPEGLSEAYTAVEGNPEDELLISEKRDEVTECLKLIPQKYREVLVLHYIEELKVGEISGILGEPEGTIKSKLSRGREKLKVQLERRQVVLGEI